MLNIGILGASHIAQKAIIEPARLIPLARVAALGCRDANRGAAYGTEHEIDHLFQDYDALINSPHVDVVYNGLPPVAHAHWTKRALAAGKHVICEKPFAMNLAQAQDMQDAARASKGRLVEAFHTAYHPAFAACLKWINNGEIGRVTSHDAHFGVPLEDDGRRNQFRPEAGGGSVMDMGCYPLQWIDACAGGEIRDIAAQAIMTPSGVDASMKITLAYDAGITATAACSMTGPGTFRAGLKITGTEGEIAFDDPLVPQDGGTLVLTRLDGTSQHHQVSPKSTYHYQLDAVFAAFERGTPLITEGAPVLRQQRLIDNVYAAAGLSHLRSDFTDT